MLKQQEKVLKDDIIPKFLSSQIEPDDQLFDNFTEKIINATDATNCYIAQLIKPGILRYEAASPENQYDLIVGNDLIQGNNDDDDDDIDDDDDDDDENDNEIGKGITFKLFEKEVENEADDNDDTDNDNSDEEHNDNNKDKKAQNILNNDIPLKTIY